MVVAAALFTGARHTNIQWNPEKDVNVFGIQCFWSFILNLGQQFEIVSSLQICPAQNSSSICQLR
jgi:hypothetical protein